MKERSKQGHEEVTRLSQYLGSNQCYWYWCTNYANDVLSGCSNGLSMNGASTATLSPTHTHTLIHDHWFSGAFQGGWSTFLSFLVTFFRAILPVSRANTAWIYKAAPVPSPTIPNSSWIYSPAIVLRRQRTLGVTEHIPRYVPVAVPHTRRAIEAFNSTAESAKLSLRSAVASECLLQSCSIKLRNSCLQLSRVLKIKSESTIIDESKFWTRSSAA